MTDTNKTAQYVTNWQDERNSAALYRAIAEVEQNPQLKRVYQRLGEAEERHSCFWAFRDLGSGSQRCFIVVGPIWDRRGNYADDRPRGALLRLAAGHLWVARGRDYLRTRSDDRRFLRGLKALEWGLTRTP